MLNAIPKYAAAFMACFIASHTVDAQFPHAPRQICYPAPTVNGKYLKQESLIQSSPYWYNDFSTPTDWLLSNTSNPARDWEISTSPLPYIGVLNSSSGGNFAGFNSEADGPNTTQDATVRIANSIDCTPLNAVQLQFEQAYMHFADQVFVEVSADSINWDQYQVNTNVPVNQMTQNPDLLSVDISATAANQPKVWIGFRFVGSWDYAWAVDDISIQAPPDNDLKLGTAFFKGTSGGFPTVNDSAWALYYTQIPSSQSAYDTLSLGGSISNNGIVQQPNTRLVGKIIGTAFYSDSSAMANLPINSTIYPELPSVFIATDTGNYDVSFTARSDSTDASFVDNALSYSFSVTDTVYARDNGVFGSGAGYSGKWAGGNVFQIHAQDSITSLAFAFHSATTPGAVVNFLIYDTTDLTTPIKTISNHVLSGNEIGNWLNVQLDTPLAVVPGVYLAAFEQTNDSDVVSIITGQNAPGAPPLTSLADVGVTGNWTYTGFTPFIRMHLAGNSCPMITSAFSVNKADCDSANGSATATPSGGISPYTYQWDNNAGNQTTQTASGLFAGLYAVTITDSIGCSGIAFVLVNNITTPVVSDSTSNASCYGNCDGQISLSVTGNSPFTYIWSNGDTTSSQGSLCPGTYYVTVTDSAGCLGVYSYSISQPPKLSLSMSQTLDYGGGTGTATATPSGGTPPYSYLWDANTGNQTDQTATGLSGGNYSVTVSDSLGCTENGNILVTAVAIGKGMESISLFPNPASGYFTLVIRNAASRFYIIRIFNELGQELHTDYIANSKQITSTFDISRFGKGVLFVSITSGQGTVFKKLICTK